MAGEKNLKYKPEYDKLVYNYCKLGANDKELAGFFGVCEATINNWKNNHETFLESLKKGKDEYDVKKVEASLLNRALGYNWEEVKEESGTNGNKTTTTTKHIPADPASIFFYLRNRNRDRWSNSPSIDDSEAQPLNITFEVKDPVGDVKVTEGKSDN